MNGLNRTNEIISLDKNRLQYENKLYNMMTTSESVNDEESHEFASYIPNDLAERQDDLIIGLSVLSA